MSYIVTNPWTHPHGYPHPNCPYTESWRICKAYDPRTPTLNVRVYAWDCA